jgi:hypothetical protein
MQTAVAPLVFELEHSKCEIDPCHVFVFFSNAISLKQPNDPDERDFVEDLLRRKMHVSKLPTMSIEDMFCRKLKQSRVCVTEVHWMLFHSPIADALITGSSFGKGGE